MGRFATPVHVDPFWVSVTALAVFQWDSPDWFPVTLMVSPVDVGAVTLNVVATAEQLVGDDVGVGPPPGWALTWIAMAPFAGMVTVAVPPDTVTVEPEQPVAVGAPEMTSQ
jgi:hypothetical protein